MRSQRRSDSTVRNDDDPVTANDPESAGHRNPSMIFGSIEREEFVLADTFLKLHWAACHVNFLFLSLSYMALYYTKYSVASRAIRMFFVQGKRYFNIPIRITIPESGS